MNAATRTRCRDPSGRWVDNRWSKPRLVKPREIDTLDGKDVIAAWLTPAQIAAFPRSVGCGLNDVRELKATRSTPSPGFVGRNPGFLVAELVCFVRPAITGSAWFSSVEFDWRAPTKRSSDNRAGDDRS